MLYTLGVLTAVVVVEGYILYQHNRTIKSSRETLNQAVGWINTQINKDAGKGGKKKV